MKHCFLFLMPSKDDRIETLVLKQRWGGWPIAVEHDWDPELVTLENGRTVDYLRPGEESELDGWMNEQRPGRGNKGRR